ncbi:hypothetical protein M404DRAFT_10556 [Pisolithus tinctorius Marx 270]|uniref:DUF659 domain-containing protein n=1 Tax=Pisolithus tinctorius Marx 270 TaxID=870435 RepID=A0A0C3NB89_PISTI|nr:hypothetical protein M404DRAFT_10556 [Pisolithus tinctorius Marx 270]
MSEVETPRKILPPNLRQEAIEASKEGSLGAQIGAAYQPDMDDVLLQSDLSHTRPQKRKAQQTLDLTPFCLAGKKRDEEARKLFQQEVDHIILHLICVCGVAPTLVDSPEWKELMAKLSPRYHPSLSTTFVNNYIPKEAVAVRQSQLAELKKHNNLTLTFDGMSTREPQSLYTVHATTPSRETYFLDGYEDSTSRHTINWVKEKLFKTINEIGAEKWAAVCSDSTAVTKNSCKEIVMCIPMMLDFNDVCHHLHNTIKNITTLECFRWMISLLKAIVKHFSKSTISVAHLRKERQVEGDDHTVNGLQKIGKTHFGTHRSAAVSLQQCLTNIKTLVENKIVKFKTVWEYGPTCTVDELHLQIDAFWRQEHPFNRPMKDGNTLAWWQAFKHHPGAQVLAALAVKIFSVLVNSMPDERTGSTFTWLNSPTCGNQNAQTLIDMVRIGQWYKDHAQVHTAEKIPFRPMVKFRDIDKDLPATITSAGTRPLSSGDPAANALIYDSNEGNDSDNILESGDEPGKFRSMFAGTTVEVDDDIDLNNPFFLDLISPVPIVQPTSTIHAPRACVQPVARGGDLDWDW